MKFTKDWLRDHLSTNKSEKQIIEKLNRDKPSKFVINKIKSITTIDYNDEMMKKSVENVVALLQTELSEALFEAYFTDGLNIGSKEILADISESVGMNKKDIIRFLVSKEGGQEVADLEMNFIEKSIGAVPTYFINDKYIIQGGQEPETFIAFLRKIINKENEAHQ